MVAASKVAQRRTDDDRAGDHLRLCAVTRAERPVEDLVRFVAAPDGEITPDLSRRLPGRGVWVSADHTSVAAAVKSKAFARSLKRQVNIPADLADRVEALLAKRTVETLALANKAGLATTGFAQVEEAIERENPALLLHASDAAPGGRIKLDRKFQAIQASMGRQAPIIDVLDITQLSLAMGRSNVVHAALKHGGVTEKFISEAGRLLRYRSGGSFPAPVDASDEAAAPIKKVETDIA